MIASTSKPEKKLFIGGNWKSNGTMAFAKDFTSNVLNLLKYDPKKLEVVVAPMTLHLCTVQSLLANDVKLCCQNISMTGQGAFTGECSAESIADTGVSWALTGHSERRVKYGETDKEVGIKTRNALSQGMSVMVCIGETLEERESGQTNAVNERQLAAVAEFVEDWSKIVIAYEPVWAIGTGKTASPEIAQDAHVNIRQFLEKSLSKEIADSTRLIYGGSVNDKNATDLIAQPDIDGFLVGSASIKPAFVDIVQAAELYDAQS